VVLEELEKFNDRKKDQLMAKLMVAKTPDEAFEVSCEYRALTALVCEAKATMAVGAAAAKELTEE
jgi:ethanolamine utilization protein EutP (predicted NTPase)